MARSNPQFKRKNKCPSIVEDAIGLIYHNYRHLITCKEILKVLDEAFNVTWEPINVDLDKNSDLREILAKACEETSLLKESSISAKRIREGKDACDIPIAAALHAMEKLRERKND